MKVISYLFVSVLVLVKANCPVGEHNPIACDDSPGSTECCSTFPSCTANGEIGYYYHNPDDNMCDCFFGVCASREYHCCSEQAAAGALIGIITGSVLGIVACSTFCCCIVCWHQHILLFGPGKAFTGRKKPASGAAQELTPVQQGLPYAPQQQIQQAVAVPEQVNVQVPKFDPQTGKQNW